jgi:hypothetical protein
MISTRIKTDSEEDWLDIVKKHELKRTHTFASRNEETLSSEQQLREKLT